MYELYFVPPYLWNAEFEQQVRNVTRKQYPQEIDQMKWLQFDSSQSYLIYWSFADLAQHPMRIYYDFGDNDRAIPAEIMFACMFDILQREYCVFIDTLFEWYKDMFPDGIPKGKFCLEVGIDKPNKNPECRQISLNRQDNIKIYDNSYYKFRVPIWFTLFKTRKMKQWVLRINYTLFEDKYPSPRTMTIEQL